MVFDHGRSKIIWRIELWPMAVHHLPCIGSVSPAYWLSFGCRKVSPSSESVEAQCLFKTSPLCVWHKGTDHLRNIQTRGSSGDWNLSCVGCGMPTPPIYIYIRRLLVS